MKNLFLISIVVFVMACSSGGNQKTVDAEEAQDAATATAESTTFTVDTTKSVVTWIGSRPGRKHNGTIPVTTGSVSVKDGTIESAQFDMDITGLKINDIEEGTEDYGKLSGHLMSEDFFAADSFPTASFELVSVAPYDSTAISDKDQYETENTPATLSEFMVENPTHLITGNLTMRGTTKSITFPANVSVKEDGVTAEAKFNIDRTDWGLMYGDEASVVDKAKDKFIYNTVNVGMSFAATEAKNDAS